MTKKPPNRKAAAAEQSAAAGVDRQEAARPVPRHPMRWENQMSDDDFLLVLDDYERKANAGDGVAVLLAFEWCGLAERPAPKWLTEMMFARLGRYLAYDVRTLDEAFDATRPAGLKLSAMRQRVATMYLAVFRFQELRTAGASADDARRKVAQEFEISDALVKKYLRLWADEQRARTATEKKKPL